MKKKPAQTAETQKDLVIINMKNRNNYTKKNTMFNVFLLSRLRFSKPTRKLRFLRHKNIMEITYIYKGQYTLIVNDVKYNLKGGDLIIVYPGEEHGSPGHPDARTVLYWYWALAEKHHMFPPDMPEEELKLCRDVLGIKKRKFRGSTAIKDIMENIISVNEKNDDLKILQFKSALTNLLINTVSLSRRQEKTISPGIKNSLDYIENNINDDIKLAALAGTSGLSLPRFKQKFKQETGIPPGEYALLQKIKKAKILLKNNNLSITGIAFELGFASSQYFATVFKRLTGEKPGEYRRKVI
ncbi:MAG: hypothetical protein A2096_02865 [Spirochaetes bacterium GWF1_41_5]|nr:MAG: hypothetical protein A2096_02865 [Spirochaetes bacterium GWF1_41_5]HBE02632.1 hypothetical protein [Spirochaetia bacterium]